MKKNSDMKVHADEVEAYKQGMSGTAPGAVAPKDAEDGHPEMGARQMPGKTKGDSDFFHYKFSTKTPVTTAPDNTEATTRCANLQIGLNLSKLKPASPPEGSTLKDREKQDFEDGLIGVP